MMCSPANATKWMSYLAEGLLAEEDVQPSLNPFFWCTNQQSVEQPDCRYVRRLLFSSPVFSNPAISEGFEFNQSLSSTSHPYNITNQFPSSVYDFTPRLLSPVA